MPIARAPAAVLAVLLTLPVLTTAPLASAALLEPAAHFERIARLQGLSHFTLLEDSNGAIWIGRDSGLERFDPVSGEQSFFALGSVRAMVSDSEGSIWVGTTDFGLLHISPELPLESRAPDVQVLAGPRIHSLAMSADGNVWIGTRFGLLCFNPGTGSLNHFEHDPHDRHSLSYNNIEDILLDSSGVIWVATWGGGVNRLDLRSTHLQRMRHDPEDSATLGHNEVMSILEHSSGTLWVGTWKGGLSRLPPGAAGFTTYRGDPSPYFSPIPTATTDTPHPAVFFATRPSKRTASAPASVESRKTQQGTTSRPSRYGIGEKYRLAGPRDRRVTPLLPSSRTTMDVCGLGLVEAESTISIQPATASWSKPTEPSATAKWPDVIGSRSLTDSSSIRSQQGC